MRQWHVYYKDGSNAGPYTTRQLKGIRHEEGIFYIEDMSMRERMNTYIEGIRHHGINMEVEVDGERQWLYYCAPDFYIGGQRVSELSIRRALQFHYSADRRRVRDWYDDTAYIEKNILPVAVR